MKIIYVKFKQFLGNTYAFLKFPYMCLKQRVLLYHFDVRSPFGGELGKNGIHKTKLSLNVIEELEEIYRLYPKKIYISKNFKEPIRELFKILNPLIKEYFGNNSYMDGIKWEYNKAQSGSKISSNWHTDNVGNRIKCFVCLRGNGSMPTMVIPSIERIPSLGTRINSFLIEWVRWIGINNYNKVSKFMKCAHKKGTIYLFDTQLLHRGGYELSNHERLIFHLEFSNPDKHKYRCGPIGTKKNNSFYFDEEILEIPEFKSLIDKKRLKNIDSIYEYTI